MILWKTVKSDTLISYVSDAFVNFGNLLTLSQSPLATPEIIDSASILGSERLTEDERGLVLQIVLRWAVLQMAPAPFDLHSVRSFDDSTWMNPLWWRFNILYHLYIDPLHPDQFFQDQKRVNSLISLMGIPTMNAFYDERKRALREVAERLIWLANADQSITAISRLAAEILIEPLSKSSRELLTIATLFRESFRFGWLQEITSLTDQKVGNEWDNLRKRHLIRLETSNRFYVPTNVRAYLSERISGEDYRSAHEQIGGGYYEEGAILAAAWHYQEGNRFIEASSFVLEHQDQLIQAIDSTGDMLREVLVRFDRSTLPDSEWGEVQSLLGRVLHKAGDSLAAITATRQALQVSDNLMQKTKLYHQLGKLHEYHMPELALTYYSQAEQICPDDTLRTALLKDRAWMYIHQKKWDAVEADLNTALTLATTQTQKADIYDAFAEMYRQQNNIDKALTQAHNALIYREESDDILALGKSYNTLGNLYSSSQQPAKGLAAHSEAFRIYKKIGNEELVATVLLNIGGDHHLLGNYQEALKYYLDSLDKCSDFGLSRQIGHIYNNLVETLIDLERYPEAEHYLAKGLFHCDTYNLQVFKNLLTQLQKKIPQHSESSLTLKPAHELALELTRNKKRLTRKSLIDASKQDQRFDKPLTTDTAKRRLADLIENDLLQKHGKGAGTYYVQPQ